jgi:AIPR protein
MSPDPNSLVSLYKKERERLFAYNIRSFLGRKGINKEIIQTASDKPKDFFYFNNGVSAICTRLDFTESTGRLVAHGFQIINGAQTIGSLKNARSLSGDVEILTRITVGSSVKTEKGFNADVIKFNNTQNVVKSSDFRSNDPIQLWLEQKFRNQRARGALDCQIEYARKRSFKRHHGVTVLRFEDLAKIRYTWIYEPTRATADPKSLWAFAADGGFYESAFGVDEELSSSWDEEAFRVVLVAVIAYWKIISRIEDTIKTDRKMLWLRRLRYLALALFKIFVLERKHTVEDLLSSSGKFDEAFKRFWSEAFRELISAHHDAVERDKTSVFALARSDSRWNSMKEKFGIFVRHTV